MQTNKTSHTIVKLLKLTKPLAGYMTMAVILGVLGFLSAAAVTVLGGVAIAQTINNNMVYSLQSIFIALGVCAVIRGFLRYGEQTFNHYIAFTLLAQIRDKVFASLRRLCPAKLETRNKGDLITIITTDIELMEVFFAHTISPVIIAIIVSVIMASLMATVSPILAVVAIISYLAIGVVLPIASAKFSSKYGMKTRKQAGEVSSLILENLRTMQDTLQYNWQDVRQEELNNQTQELIYTQEKFKGRTAHMTAMSFAMVAVSMIVMMMVGGNLIQTGQASFTQILLCVMGLSSTFAPVLALANLGGTLQPTLAAANRVISILEETPEVEEETTKLIQHSFENAQVKNVTFSYEDNAVISNANLNIPKNKVIGLTGKSGSGKSTLMRLIMRFWDTSLGEIEINNTNIKDINTKDLRNMQSFVTQQTHLFRDSIAENLKIAKPDATDDELVIACKKASIHDFIMTLPNGYDTLVGELGDTLSGGEKQRIGLARAFLHKAPFILLDEPTSNLDSLNEAVILKSLSESCNEKTILIVSHRISALAVADEIIDMKKVQGL